MSWITFVFLLAGIPQAWGVDCRIKEEYRPKASAGYCQFSVASKSFKGTPAEQAACLTRKVKPNGDIGEKTITPYLEKLLDQSALSDAAVKSYLDTHNIKPNEIGGQVTKNVKARYFVIHDTSTPLCSKSSACGEDVKFPADINKISWKANENFIGHPMPAPYRAANTMINRLGASITEADFSEIVVATKFEQCVDAESKMDLFVGVENIQPRLHDPSYKTKNINDYRAPDPGFTPEQYDRLALMYIIASARHGSWLIPIFHGVLDAYYVEGHNDPQNFEMGDFSNAVKRISDEVAQLQKQSPTQPPQTNAEVKTITTSDSGALTKRVMPAFKSKACERIAAAAPSLQTEAISEVTKYYTVLLRPDPVDLKSTKKAHAKCPKIEGSCIVGDIVYDDKGNPSDRKTVAYIFGQGNGESEYNRTNALFPCRTLAADQKNYYPQGTVIYIPSSKGLICPQNGEPIDGCFIVSDVGGAIEGQGRFDAFTGECIKDGKKSFCHDKWNPEFKVNPGAIFYKVPRDSDLASALRDEVDAFIKNKWMPGKPVAP